MADATIASTDTPDGRLRVVLGGDWLAERRPPEPGEILERLSGAASPAGISFDTRGLGDWDSGLVVALIKIFDCASERDIPVAADGLPSGADRLIKLARAVKEREGARRTEVKKNAVTRIGEQVLEAWADAKELVRFVGELFYSFQRLFKGRAGYQKSDLLVYIEDASAEALPIVGLISFLIGMIFAFVGVMQLEAFAAGIYTANLVAVAMVREMAPIMTGIIMAGRTGASYAAQLGTMKVNEEIDALTTLGIKPMDFLVLPRVLALILMMPLLTMYSSLLGIVGGLFVALAMLDVSIVQYLVQTKESLGLNSLFGGLFKCIVYGSLVALAGCQQGMACGGSASAVGQATTNAVVQGIVLIVVSASILTIIYINLGI